MLNAVFLMGNITHDLTLKRTQDGVSVVNFQLAVDREYANKGGERETDFFPCVAWRGVADYAASRFRKGERIVVKGNLKTSVWEKDGVSQKVTQIIAGAIYPACQWRTQEADAGAS